MHFSFITNLSIGLDSFLDALYWRKNLNDQYDCAAFWMEVNSGWYQLNPDLYQKDYLGEGFVQSATYCYDGDNDILHLVDYQ